MQDHKMATTSRQNGRRSKWDNPEPAPSSSPSPSLSSGSATEAAREAARKLNAMLAAKGKLTTNNAPPLLPPKISSTATTKNDSNSSLEMFTEEIEINDCPRRLVLCKGTVQYEINKYSGAAVSTKGQYIPASEWANYEGQRPLYLFIQGPTKEKVNLAVKRIHEILNGADPFSTPATPPPNPSQSLPAGMHYVQDKVFVGLDNVPPEFNLKEKLVGPGESYFQHIARETGAKVHLRGRGSGFIEPTSGREAFEALYIYISHNSYAGLAAAKKLVENLIQTVTSTYQTFQQQQSNARYPGYGGHGARLPHHHIYMPPVQGYGVPPHPVGAPPHPVGAPSYPPYPHPPNHYPPRYNQPHQSPPNQVHNDPPLPRNQPPPLHQRPIQEGHRPRMNEPSFRHSGPYSSAATRPPAPRVPSYPPVPRPSPHQEPPHFNDSKTDPPFGVTRETENKLVRDDEKPRDPPKRRFTEAPARRVAPDPPQPDRAADRSAEQQRSVSSLDQPTTPFSAPSHTPGDGHNSTMRAPALPAPRVKPASNVKQEDGFKAPLLPVSAPVSAKKTHQPPGSSSGRKRKLDEPEKTSSGFALLGSYDDSSEDEDA